MLRKLRSKRIKRKLDQALHERNWSGVLVYVAELKRLDPSDVSAYMYEAEAKAKLRDDQGVRQACKAGLKVYSKASPLLRRLGHLAIRDGRYEDAKALFEQALEEDRHPERTRGLIERCEALIAKRRIKG